MWRGSMMREPLITIEKNALLRDALRDTSYISGGTHDFYHYPARFSPRFAAVAIEALSDVGNASGGAL